MNLDELKSAWDKENTSDVSIPETVQQLKNAQHPLDKLKRNMKNEWFLQLISIIALAFIPQLQNIHTSLWPFYYLAYSFLLIISAYYLNRFRIFYRQISHYSTDTKESVTVIYNEFKLNIERYHSFGFLLLPFALAWIAIFIYSKLLKQGRNLETISDNTKIFILVAIIVMVVAVVFGILGWTKYYYGKYLKKLKAVLEELKSD